MKLKKKLYAIFIFSLIISGWNAIICQANTLSQRKGCYVDAEDDYNHKFVKIHMPRSGVLSVSFDVKFQKESAPVIEQSLGLTVRKIIYNEYFTEQNLAKIDIDNCSYLDFYQYDIYYEEPKDVLWDSFYNKKSGYIYSNVQNIGPLSAGDYIFDFFNGTGHDWNLNYTISWYQGYAESLILPSEISFNEGSSYTLKLATQPSNSLLAIDQIYSSNNAYISAKISGNYVTVSAEKAGNYTLYIRLLNGKVYSVKLDVKKTSIPKIKYSSYTLYQGQSFKNAILYTSKKATWSSSNKKIATVNNAGKVVAKKTGTCKITAKIGKKRYQCTLKVKYRMPDFFSCITDYNRTGNYFKVRIKNNGSKPLTICSSGSKAINWEFNSLNRKLKLSKNKNVTIKTNQEKTLKFYVKGSRTWYDHEDFDIIYKIKYDGKSYDCVVESLYSSFKNSEKPTYSDGEMFYKWAGI